MPFCRRTVFLVLEDNEITESRNSFQIIEGRNSLERIVEGRNSPTKTITREQWDLWATVLFFSAVEGLECALVASARWWVARGCVPSLTVTDDYP